MKRLGVCGILCCLSTVMAFAGDVAAFKDIGFSADGTVYVFAEYGVTDKYFQGYGEIYAVDVEKNAYVPGGVFTTEPSQKTAGVNGGAVYNELYERGKAFLAPYNCEPVSAEQMLYVRGEDAASADAEISFKDFRSIPEGESPLTYSVKLVPHIEGSGASVESSFFIVLEKKDGAGTVVERTVVGNPQIKRRGVSAYAIDRIFTDKSDKSLVFVVEKTLHDAQGSSIRYMVETYR
ncbi:MAG TPA: DUF2259 domain-containing protein, partial [Candidatus Treponema faecavium]|nr:DUF2259 domain-containing protein [Candidatus Treponema faecavium]